tara:strand:- start:13070 stop:14374 length:1305 start_codon:yes stop_codon:yes gene_type:complete
MLENLRRHLFWVLDFFKGGKVNSNYKDVKKINENSTLSQILDSNKDKLDLLLKHIVSTVPFYSSYDINNEKLTSFPVVNKLIIRENFENFKSINFLNSHNHMVTTSGSTGQPFKIYHDLNKRNRNTADTIYFGQKAGFKIGNRLFYLRLWDKQYKKNELLSWFQNIAMYSVDDMDDNRIKKLIDELKNNGKGKGILGYSSALQTLCKYLDRIEHKPIHGKCSSVIAIAETLNEYVKERFNYYFGIEAVSRYSNSENGIIAQQALNSKTGHFKINWASYHIEILDLNKDIPVPLGTLGRIVITDLYNYAMPMVRYDTGDVGIIKNVEGELVFTKIDGRKMDMFTNTKGEFLSSHIIHKILQYRNIDQFQFIQEERANYTIKLKLLENFNFEDEEKIIKEYEAYFGDGSSVNVVYVDHIPALKSGKRKLVVNNVLM